MFLALHRSLVDAPFFAADAPARAAPSSPSAAATEAAAAVDAAVEPAAAAAAEAGAAHHSTTSSSPSVVRLASGLAAAVATEPRTRAAEADAAPVLRAAVLLVGSVRNEAELAREYSFEMATGDPDEDDLAATVLDLYARGFADESGDASDEPAALLAMLRGSWVLAVVAEKALSPGSCGGGTGLHVIVARSAAANGKNVKEAADDDEMEEAEDDGDGDESGEDGEEERKETPPPLFWGVTENNPDALVVSSTPQPGLSPFPAGCFYESSPVSSSSEEEGGSGGGGKTTHCRIDQFSRRFASKATREVVVAPGGGGAAGIVRPLRYKTRSGKDLKVVE